MVITISNSSSDPASVRCRGCALSTRCLAMAIPRLFVAADMCVNFVAGRCLAMDVRTDSAIQAFRRHATTYF
jgi:hypothetical protein